MNIKDIEIRKANEHTFNAVMEVESLAFGEDAEANLVRDLLNDKSAEPILSLLAFYDNKAIGHILFTKATVENNKGALAHLLAPLAVLPEFQGMGIGGLLINKGIGMLKEEGAELVFVLGHKTYYPKFGFIPNAERLGFPAPYQIPEKDAEAWMVQSLTEGGIKKRSGKIRVANKLMKPEYWRE